MWGRAGIRIALRRRWRWNGAFRCGDWKIFFARWNWWNCVGFTHLIFLLWTGNLNGKILCLWSSAINSNWRNTFVFECTLEVLSVLIYFIILLLLLCIQSSSFKFIVWSLLSLWSRFSCSILDNSTVFILFRFHFNINGFKIVCLFFCEYNSLVICFLCFNHMICEFSVWFFFGANRCRLPRGNGVFWNWLCLI